MLYSYQPFFVTSYHFRQVNPAYRLNISLNRFACHNDQTGQEIAHPCYPNYLVSHPKREHQIMDWREQRNELYLRHYQRPFTRLDRERGVQAEAIGIFPSLALSLVLVLCLARIRLDSYQLQFFNTVSPASLQLLPLASERMILGNSFMPPSTLFLQSWPSINTYLRVEIISFFQ